MMGYIKTEKSDDRTARDIHTLARTAHELMVPHFSKLIGTKEPHPEDAQRQLNTLFGYAVLVAAWTLGRVLLCSEISRENLIEAFTESLKDQLADGAWEGEPE